MITPRITQETESYVRHYPRIVEIADRQLEDQLWFKSEMKVELDKMQLEYELTEAQLHAVKTVLHLFLKYELVVGDFWTEVVAKIFPRPEVKLATSVINMVERAIHAEFYDKINIVLGMDKEEDYLAFTEDKELAERVEWLGKLMSDEDKIKSVITFGLTETSLLFSSFSILKSFQSNGYNQIPVIVRGTNQSAIDEDLHGELLAEIINTYYNELGISLIEDAPRYEALIKAAQYAYDHECRIIDMAFLEDSLNGSTKEDMKNFVKYRINIWFNRLNLPEMFSNVESPIIDWFEKNTYSYKVIDFFTAGIGMEYSSGWDEEEFGKCWEESN